MLILEDKYHFFDPDYWKNMIPAFDSRNHELTIVPLGYEGTLVTNLEQIAQNVNSLAKPIYRSINIFYNIFRNIEKINELIKEKNQVTLINTNEFIFCLRPTAHELKERLWAIHVSDYLWPDAVMTPVQKTLGTMDLNPSLSSLTIHFSLGEMVRPHGLSYNWKYRDFAILTPLAEIMPQLAGIYPYDSFIHGAWKITSKAILVIPKGTIVPEIYSKLGLDIVAYDPEKASLRTTIKTLILSRNGVFLKMSRNLTIPGAPAYLYGNKQINVNNPEFFDELFEENKNLSFGSDTSSLNAKLGYCFGFIRQMSSAIVNIGRKEAHHYYPYLQFAYEKIKEDLTIDEDKQISDFLSKYRPLSKLNPSGIVCCDFICNLDFRELQEFKVKYPDLFAEHISDATWAIKRWLMLGRKQSSKENLENIYRQNLNEFLLTDNLLFDTDINRTISQHLESQSERAELVLYILNLPETRRYNLRVAQQFVYEKERGLKIISQDLEFFIPKYSADSIKSALSAHSKFCVLDGSVLQTINAIRKHLVNPNMQDFEKLCLFANLPLIQFEIDEDILLSSYSNLFHVKELIPGPDTIKELYETKIMNLGTLPSSALCEWKLYPIQKLWRKFNLEKEFNEFFPDDKMFWDSENTFVEIYRKLKAIKEANMAPGNMHDGSLAEFKE